MSDFAASARRGIAFDIIVGREMSDPVIIWI